MTWRRSISPNSFGFCSFVLSEFHSQIWFHSYYEQLRVAPEEHYLLLSESPSNSNENREKTAQVMFETFLTTGLYLVNQAALSLFAYGRTSGVVLDSGHGVTHAVPIYEGFALSHATQRLNFGGHDVTEYMRKLLSESGISFPSSSRLDIVRDIKEFASFNNSIFFLTNYLETGSLHS